MFLENTKSSVLNKLIPKGSSWSKNNITPISSDFGNVKFFPKTQQNAEDNFEMIRKINRLKFELKDNKTKLKFMKEK